MPALTRSELAAYAVCALVIAVLGWRALRGARVDFDDGGAAVSVRDPATARGATGARGTTRGGADGGALVHVIGAVRRPGVYRLRAGSRVIDAVERAGGATERAELAGLNLAARVADAQQIAVPRRGGRASAMAAGAASPAANGVAGGPIDLNTATLEQLDTLDGVGPVIARKIIEHRARNGPFRSVDELAQVPGIGPKRLAALRAHVRV